MGALDGNEVKRVYIDPNDQGKGVGSKIMTYLENLAVKNRLKFLITDSSPNAEKFYQNHGFKPLKKYILLKKKAIFQFIKMRKRIPQHT